MKIDTKRVVPASLLQLEAVQLAWRIERALCNPAAASDRFFLDVDHLADVLEMMQQDTAPGTAMCVS